MMNEVLEMIDDLKKVKEKLVSGDTDGTIKLIDEIVAYKEREIKQFEDWLEKEHQVESGRLDIDDGLDKESQLELEMPFPEVSGSIKHQ